MPDACRTVVRGRGTARRVVLGVTMGLLALPLPALAIQDVATPDVAGYTRCVDQWSPWNADGGIWLGEVGPAGVRRGDPQFRRVQVHLHFTAAGATVSIRRPGRPWRKLGTDPKVTPRQAKDQVFVGLPGERQALGHAVMLTRLSDTVARAVYTRTVPAGRPGTRAGADDVMNGVVSRKGAAIPAGIDTLGSPCHR